MPNLGARHVAHAILKGADFNASTHPSVIAKSFREDVAMTIARGRFGESIAVNSNEITLTERQEGRRVAATSIGNRLNRIA